MEKWCVGHFLEISISDWLNSACWAFYVMIKSVSIDKVSYLFSYRCTIVMYAYVFFALTECYILNQPTNFLVFFEWLFISSLTKCLIGVLTGPWIPYFILCFQNVKHKHSEFQQRPVRNLVKFPLREHRRGHRPPKTALTEIIIVG